MMTRNAFEASQHWRDLEIHGLSSGEYMFENLAATPGVHTCVVAPSTLIVHQTYHRSAPTPTPLEQAQAITARS